MKSFLFALLLVGCAGLAFTGCDEPMMDSAMDVVTPTEMATIDDPEAFAVAFVQAAIDLYKTEGREAAITYYNDPASVNGQWYVFMGDENNTYVAHPLAPEFLGTDLTQIPGIDGSPAGVNIAMATADGIWTRYLWPNPDTGKLAQKRTWSIRHDGYLFASGYYQPWSPDPAMVLKASKDDPEAFTRDLVLSAIARYESEGVAAAAAYYNDPANIDGQWYVFMTGANDLFAAHAPRPDFIGTDLKDVLGLDGGPLGAEIAKATGTGLWIEYLWPNPESGMDELKRTWAIRHDGYLFGSGYYAPVPDEPELLIDLLAQLRFAKTGVIVDGVEWPLDLSQGQDEESGATFSYYSNAPASGITKPAIDAHPPWKIAGDTFGEWTFVVPQRPHIRLEFYIGLLDGSENSDGVTFIVSVQGEELFRQHHAEQRWEPIGLDLTSYRGTEVTLRFTTTPGPDGKAGADWGYWGEPKIVAVPLVTTDVDTVIAPSQ